MRLEELLDVLWNPFTEPLPWPISLVPSFFRFISYAMLAPVFILSTLDLREAARLVHTALLIPLL